MKKLAKMLPLMFVVMVVSFAFVKKAVAGSQYNWGTSTGVSWTTPDDTATKTNQFLQIGNSTTSVVAVSTPAITPTTLAVMNASTPTYVGQLIYVSNAVASPLCISTNTVGSPNGSNFSWVAVTSSNNFVGGPFKCQ